MVWRWFPGSVGVTSLSRVTADGGLAFARRLDSTGLPGVGPDGLGGLIDAWSANGDIAFRHVTATGSSEPASPQNYWAAQTPDLDDFPAVAPDSAGGVYIGWTDQQGDFVVQRVTAAGGRAPGRPT